MKRSGISDAYRGHAARRRPAKGVFTSASTRGLCPALLVLAAALASCSPAPKAPSAPATTYQTSIPVPEVMAHVMNPAAFQFWAGAGTSYTDKGLTDLSPKTEEEWKRVEDGAATVVLTTNSLKLPGYAREPVADWNRHADGVAELALKGKAAVEQRNVPAIFQIGADLDEACEACHKQFIPNYSVANTAK